MIEAAELSKVYDGFVAVDDSSFTVEQGEIFGLVGPNGAGKTTTLKMLAGLVEPTAGRVRLLGDPPEEPSTRRKLGFLPEESPLYEDMTALSYLRFFADLYDVPREVADERIGEALDRLELDHRERRLGDVSKGMKRKVAIARSLVNDPSVVIYDEPASGLDPLTTNYVLEFTRTLSEEGKTVVFSAHNLYHVESVCDRVAIMNRGEIIARGTIPEIRAAHGDTEYRVDTTVPVAGAEAVEDATGQERYRRVVDDMAAVEDVRTAAEAAGGRVADIRTSESTLEEIFLELAGGSPGEREHESAETAGVGSGRETATGREDASPESERETSARRRSQ
jgi:ABC-2 type transport system ATP-binding protein